MEDDGKGKRPKSPKKKTTKKGFVSLFMNVICSYFFNNIYFEKKTNFIFYLIYSKKMMAKIYKMGTQFIKRDSLKREINR